jgi:hypothetical protein
MPRTPHLQLPPGGGQAGPSRAAWRATPPSRRRLAARTSSRLLSLPSPAGYPPAHISRIRTTTSSAAVPKSSMHIGVYVRARGLISTQSELGMLIEPCWSVATQSSRRIVI